MEDNSLISAVVGFITAVCVLFLVSLVFALPVLWLWNSTVPEVFGLKEINWWTAWKLSMLSTLLFKNFFITSSSNK